LRPTVLRLSRYAKQDLLKSVNYSFLIQRKQYSVFYERPSLPEDLNCTLYVNNLNRVLMHFKYSSYLQKVAKSLKPEHVSYLTTPGNETLLKHFDTLVLNPNVLVNMLLTLFIFFYFPKLIGYNRSINATALKSAYFTKKFNVSYPVKSSTRVAPNKSRLLPLNKIKQKLKRSELAKQLYKDKMKSAELNKIKQKPTKLEKQRDKEEMELTKLNEQKSQIQTNKKSS